MWQIFRIFSQHSSWETEKLEKLNRIPDNLAEIRIAHFQENRQAHYRYTNVLSVILGRIE
jgi:hypothetical protein